MKKALIGGGGFALFVISGYYQNGRDNIDSECIASCNQPI
jgi:hypothetical protein